MTVGEKIQFYRKKLGLSQEALGQKMLVSRQTVSLWEMDKTLPTVDNLILLKEIFSVSIDDILSNEESIEEKVKEPKESYVFQYEKSDLREIFKKAQLYLIMRIVTNMLLCIVCMIILFASSIADMIAGGLFGYFFIVIVSQIKGIFAYRKAWRARESKMMESTYSYEVFEDYLLLNISRNNEITTIQKVFFNEIEKIQSLGKYLVFQLFGQSYIIKKDSLIPDSAFTNLLENPQNIKVAKNPQGILKMISTLLVFLSVCTPWGALYCESLLFRTGQMITENMWVFYLFLPVPIMSIGYGFYLKKKGYKYKKNVIVGFIMAVILCVFGSFSIIFEDEYSYSDEPIRQAEQLLNIDIPAHLRIYTREWPKETVSTARGSILSTSSIYFDNDDVEEFEKNLPNDEKWRSEISNDMIGITSYAFDILTNGYYIIYNKDTGEFNKIPDESGTYVFVNVLYDVENDAMQLIEYQIEYIK